MPAASTLPTSAAATHNPVGAVATMDASPWTSGVVTEPTGVGSSADVLPPMADAMSGAAELTAWAMPLSYRPPRQPRARSWYVQLLAPRPLAAARYCCTPCSAKVACSRCEAVTHLRVWVGGWERLGTVCTHAQATASTPHHRPHRVAGNEERGCASTAKERRPPLGGSREALPWVRPPLTTADDGAERSRPVLTSTLRRRRL